MSDKWIWINRWEDFQHYKPEPGRVPAWTKMYTQLINDEAYLELSSGRRALLHGLWLSFTSARLHLRFDILSLNSRMRLRAKMSDYEALQDAGFIVICSRETLEQLYSQAMRSLESRASARSREVDKEKEKIRVGSKRRGVAERKLTAWQDKDDFTPLVPLVVAPRLPEEEIA